MNVGDIVEITEGPLVGCLASFAGVEQRRALVVIELQGRQIKVEIDADWIVETTPARKSVHGVDSLEGRSRRRG
jgi:transcription antitermination factor NusG